MSQLGLGLLLTVSHRCLVPALTCGNSVCRPGNDTIKRPELDAMTWPLCLADICPVSIQVHTNIVVFDLRKSCPLAAKDVIIALQQRGVYVIPFR